VDLAAPPPISALMVVDSLPLMDEPNLPVMLDEFRGLAPFEIGGGGDGEAQGEVGGGGGVAVCGFGEEGGGLIRCEGTTTSVESVDWRRQ
jgi:hypothetical protein